MAKISIIEMAPGKKAPRRQEVQDPRQQQLMAEAQVQLLSLIERGQRIKELTAELRPLQKKLERMEQGWERSRRMLLEQMQELGVQHLAIEEGLATIVEEPEFKAVRIPYQDLFEKLLAKMRVYDKDVADVFDEEVILLDARKRAATVTTVNVRSAKESHQVLAEFQVSADNASIQTHDPYLASLIAVEEALASGNEVLQLIEQLKGVK